MRIAEVAALAGVSARAVRHYHRVGALPEPSRAGNGYREYTLDDVARLLRVRSLLASGVPLRRIAALGEAGPGAGGQHPSGDGVSPHSHPLAPLLAELRLRRDDLDARIARLEVLVAAGRDGEGEVGARAREAREALGVLADRLGLDAGAVATERAMLDLLAARGDTATPLAAVAAGYRALAADPATARVLPGLLAEASALAADGPVDDLADRLARFVPDPVWEAIVRAGPSGPGAQVSEDAWIEAIAAHPGQRRLVRAVLARLRAGADR